MPLMVLNRTHSHVSMTGHGVGFVKNKPSWVSPLVVDEALALGAEFVDASDKPILDEDGLAPTPEGEERHAAIRKAMGQLLQRNGREDFTASGLPQVKALSAIVGFAIDPRERNEQWGRFIDEKNEAERIATLEAADK
jgi:hypothetical protein